MVSYDKDGACKEECWFLIDDEADLARLAIRPDHHNAPPKAYYPYADASLVSWIVCQQHAEMITRHNAFRALCDA